MRRKISKIGKSLRIIIGWLTGSTLGLICLLILLINIPTVQNKISGVIISRVSGATGFDLSVSEVHIAWLDKMELYGVSIKDRRDTLMLYAKKVNVNFSLVGLLENNSINIDRISADSLALHLRRHEDGESMNLSRFLAALKTDSNRTSRPIHVDQIVATNLYTDYLGSYDSVESATKPLYIALSRIQTGRMNLYPGEIYLKEILADSGSLSGFLQMDSFKSNLTFTQTEMEFSNLEFLANGVQIKDFIRLNYQNPNDLKDFIESVRIESHFEESSFDLGRLLPVFGIETKLDEEIRITSDITGSVSRLRLQNTLLIVDEESRFQLSADLNGLPDIEKTFILLDVKQSIMTENVMSKFFPENLPVMSDIRFDGEFVGFMDDFVAKGNFQTPFGNLKSDVNLKLGTSVANTYVSGNLGLSEFDIGTYLNRSKLVGKVNLNGSIEGYGLTRESANYQISAVITNSEILQHTYDNISLSGIFKSRYFSGNVSVIDPEVTLHGTTEIDFSNSREVIDLDMRVDSVDLLAYGINDQPSFLSFSIDGDLEELNVNDLTGNVKIKNLVFRTQDSTHRVADFLVTAETEPIKKYAILSKDFNVSMEGDFKLTDLVRDLPKTIFDFQQYFTSDKGEIIESLKREDFSDSVDYRAHIVANFKDLSSVFKVFGVQASHSDDFFLESTLRKKNDATFDLYIAVDTFYLGDRVFLQNDFEMNASKDLDSLGVLALIQMSSSKQSWDIFSETEDLFVESIWNNNQLQINFSLASPQTNSRAKIRSDVSLLKDTVSMRIRSSGLVAFDKPWTINDRNEIFFMEGTTIINDLEILGDGQSLGISGQISDSSLTEIFIDFKDFNLENVSTVIPRKFNGRLTGSGRLFRQTPTSPFNFTSQSRITNLEFEDILVGNLEGETKFDRSSGGLYLNYNLERSGINTVGLTGYINPEAENQIDIRTVFDQANFNVLEPFFNQTISNVRGLASGDLRLSGKFEDPKISGNATISEGLVTVDYLNTTYSFFGPVSFDRNTISFDDLHIRDRQDNRGVVRGVIKHSAFRNIQLNLSLDHQNLELLNTNRGDNTLYYGTAYSTGIIYFSGPLQNILIRANARTEPNTRIYIPFTDNTEVAQNDFISFISTDSNKEQEDDQVVTVRGITLDFDVEVTEDAYIELIFDPRTGDIIRGRGNGNLQLNIDPNGNFELFGNIAIRNGAYNFTTSLINKEFQLEPGGTISWYGDPYGGILGLEANYRQLAAYDDWRPNLTSDGNGVSPKQPVLVNLGLSGELMNPDISFGIEMEDPNIVNTNDNWRNLITSVNNNPEELKRQVFSLLMLRKFSQENSFVVGISEGIGNSVSEFVSNQLSYWINQVDENLEVSIDLNSLDTDAFNTFQLRLAYTFLDGRLRVTRGGGLTTVVDSNDGGVTGVIGDWSVEYLLTEDGRFRVKAFSRNNQGSLSQTLTEQQTGASIQFIRSFDELKELLERSKKEKSTDTDSTTASTSQAQGE